jgi:hypothetical protein
MSNGMTHLIGMQNGPRQKKSQPNMGTQKYYFFAAEFAATQSWPKFGPALRSSGRHRGAARVIPYMSTGPLVIGGNSFFIKIKTYYSFNYT